MTDDRPAAVYTADAVAAEIELMRCARECNAADNQRGDADAQQQHAYEQLAFAARELVRAINNLTFDEQPVGWREPVWSVCCGGTGYAGHAAIPCPAPYCPVPLSAAGKAP